MNKSVRLHLLVITTVVSIFVFAGIWYLRPGVPNELLEEARARQLQPLLEIDAPIRKPVAESVPTAAIDKKALAEELLPSLTDQVSRSLEAPLYEKLKTQLASDEAFVTQLSGRLAETLNLEALTQPIRIPEGLQADFSRQLEALRTEMMESFGEGQSSFFYQIEGMLDERMNRLEKDLNDEMQAYVPQLVDRMIPSLVEMLADEFEKKKESFLPYLAQEMKPYLTESFTEEELMLLYASYRDQAVADLVPPILTAMEEPAREEVAAMVKTFSTPAPPPPSTISVEKSEVATTTAEPKADIPKPPVMRQVKSVVVEPKPVLAPPNFSTDGPEVFVDPAAYEKIRTEVRTKAIEEVLERINAL